MRLRNSVLLFLSVFLFRMFPLYGTAQNGPTNNNSRNDFKFTLLSLGSGSARITYERAFSPINSGEFTLGFIGLGWDWLNDSHPRGLLLKLAYKWRLLPQRSSDSWLAGFYVKPELAWAGFSHRYKYQEPVEEPSKCPDRTIQMALLAECGYQLLKGWFVFDIYSGLGPSVGTKNDYNYYHSFMLFPKDGWLAFTAGFRIGVAF